MTHGWTVRDTQFLIDNLDALSIYEIAEKLGKTHRCVRQKIIRLEKSGLKLPYYNPVKGNEPPANYDYLWPP